MSDVATARRTSMPPNIFTPPVIRSCNRLNRMKIGDGVTSMKLRFRRCDGTCGPSRSRDREKPFPDERRTNVTAYQNAARIWPILTQAARNRETLNFETIGRLIGVPRLAVGHHLEPIQSFCVLNGLPPLAILVVREGAGSPGAGLSAASDLPQLQTRVFAHDWSSVQAPTPKEFKEAVERSPAAPRAEQRKPERRAHDTETEQFD